MRQLCSHVAGCCMPKLCVIRTRPSRASGPIAATSASLTPSERPAVIANMSARVGSIGDNSLGGW